MFHKSGVKVVQCSMRKGEAPQHHCTSANGNRTYYELNPSELYVDQQVDKC